MFVSLSQRIGYLAATQCFHEGLDVVMLTTNMIRKVRPMRWHGYCCHGYCCHGDPPPIGMYMYDKVDRLEVEYHSRLLVIVNVGMLVAPFLALSSCLLSSSFTLLPLHFSFFQDMSSGNQFESGLALNGLSCFMTPDLARDLANDVVTVVSS